MANSLELGGSQINLLKLSPLAGGGQQHSYETHATGERGRSVQRRQRMLAGVLLATLRANSISRVWKFFPALESMWELLRIWKKTRSRTYTSMQGTSSPYVNDPCSEPSQGSCRGLKRGREAQIRFLLRTGIVQNGRRAGVRSVLEGVPARKDTYCVPETMPGTRTSVTRGMGTPRLEGTVPK